MAKQKPKETEELVVPEETAIAEPMDVMDYLKEAAEQDFEPAFVPIQISHGTATFASQGFGAGPEFKAMILAAPTFRALWGFGTEDEKELIKKWTGGLPICGSRDENARLGKGELPKPIDADAPDFVREMVDAVMKTDFRCKPCAWAAFGSIPGQRGQACKKCVRLLLWEPDGLMAGMLTVPPTSLRYWRNYKAGLPGQHYSTVVTGFRLNEENVGERTYSTLRFSIAGEITEGMKDGLRRKIYCQGQQVALGIALHTEFLRLDLSQDQDYLDNGDKEGDDF